MKQKLLFVNDKYKLFTIGLPDIVLLQQQRRHLELVTKHKTFELEADFHQLQKQLPRRKFILVRKNCLVRAKKIICYDPINRNLYLQPQPKHKASLLPDTWLKVPVGKSFTRWLKREQVVYGREKKYALKLDLLLSDMEKYFKRQRNKKITKSSR